MITIVDVTACLRPAQLDAIAAKLGASHYDVVIPALDLTPPGSREREAQLYHAILNFCLQLETRGLEIIIAFYDKPRTIPVTLEAVKHALIGTYAYPVVTVDAACTVVVKP